MLDAKREAYLLPSEPTPIAADEPSAAETIARGLGVVRRQIFVVLGFALLGVALGAFYVLKAPPKYTATVTLLADTRKMELIQQPTVYNEASIQSVGAMETQVELLRSDEVALSVIKKLNLSEDPRFRRKPPSKCSSIAPARHRTRILSRIARTEPRRTSELGSRTIRQESDGKSNWCKLCNRNRLRVSDIPISPRR